VFREVYGQAVATLVRVLGDITLAEDAVQDAFAVASDRWPRDGTPPNPAGWIITTARNRAIDDHRRLARGRELHEEIIATDSRGEEVPDPAEDGSVSDDQLRLIFTCCHPALRPDHQVALTLRLLGGLSVDEVARSSGPSSRSGQRRSPTAFHRRPSCRSDSVLFCLSCISSTTLGSTIRSEPCCKPMRFGSAGLLSS